jgi:hypothetical protein
MAATDYEVRGAVLRRFYERRNESHGHYGLLVSDFAGAYSYGELQRICDQLAEKGLISWKQQFTGSGDMVGMGKLLARGSDVIEGNVESPISINLDQSVAIHNSQNIAVGNNNTQHWQGHFDALVKAIDASNFSAAEKHEAKSRLNEFLSHPLVAAIVGAVATAWPGNAG